MTSKEAALTVQRLWPVFMRMRLAVALMLLGLQLLVSLWGQPTSRLTFGVCLTHLLLCGLVMALPQYVAQRTYLSWALTIGTDVLAFAILQVLQTGSLNYALLFALPVLMSASLGAKRLSLAIAASVTLLMLLDTARFGLDFDIALSELAPRLFQTAITGTAFFLVALLAYQLAVRLAREEANAEKNRRAAHSQSLVNQLVIETLSMGILVVDEQGMVKTANPAARHLLGDPRGPAPVSFLLASRSHCMALAELVNATFAEQREQTADLTVEPSPELRHRIRIRTRLTPALGEERGDAPSLCVLFLEDRLELEAQLRTEKLAAMGRMSVAVAHEIRNPLSAIAQANALLQEDLQDPLQLRLSDMIRTHTHRLNRIVDDVLNVVRVPSRPAAPGSVTPLMLDQSVQVILAEWCGQHACTLRMGTELLVPTRQVAFDPEHLRRVLVNLLDNASRYASQQAQAIQVSTRIEADWLRVSVWSDGQPLDATVHRHLFEPFFSSESRSSGLGLYLCRELCERYGASLNYQRSTRQGREGNDFYLLIPTTSSITAPALTAPATSTVASVLPQTTSLPTP